MVQGKKVFNQVVNSSCFRVKTTDDKLLQGREKFNEVVKDLLQKDASVQPTDFMVLKKLIDTRINGIRRM